ncbi:MlaD family protein [Metapseudomonas furukawaii]|uniref:ABC-type transport system involved in resistance to organic solvents n=1 Tax=Metapseudomonas furukawaii TaxID=1149133 RepID=A0AAD1BZY3_METFU|nr:MlaD family protein [Pseudomonas furukawaii]ELS26773.1 ABC-type transport system [Pseudomonas furukawaii]BAU73413.1 ABC-type transport system involved in resistance to organic solvents [Pseudomonas furukawaii]
METRAHHVLIGLFTVLVVGAAMLFALWLSRAGSDQQLQEYEVVFTEAVTGLSQGSAVQYSGIKVGDVTQLRLDKDDPRKVRARIRIVGGTPIKVDTRARLSITGVTGTAVIQLHGGSPDSPLLGGKGGKVPVIVADPSPLARLMAGGEDVMLSVTRLLEQANKLFSDENVRQVSLTLANLEQTTAGLAGQREELRGTLAQVNAATREATALLHNANGLLEGEGRQAFASAERLLASLERSSRNVEHLLNENRDSLDGGMKSLGELGPAIGQLRETLESLRSFSRRLEENPGGYLLRSENLKEFQP